MQLTTNDEPKKRPSTDGYGVEKVYAQLRRAILFGELAPGAELSQVRLAPELGVSRTPLREALRMLISDGLVEGEANQTLRVAGISVERMEEHYATRVALESLAIHIAVPRLTGLDIAALEGRMAEMDYFSQQQDFVSWEIPHADFHRRLVEPAGPGIAQTLSELSDFATRYRWTSATKLPPRVWSVGVTEHREILNACAAGERDRAAAAMADHLASTALALIELIQPGYEAVTIKTAVEMAHLRLDA